MDLSDSMSLDREIDRLERLTEEMREEWANGASMRPRTSRTTKGPYIDDSGVSHGKKKQSADEIVCRRSHHQACC